MHACFDMDGVLADTHSLTVDAYSRVGVIMPHDAWGLSWRSWLIDYLDGDEDEAVRVHTAKTATYSEMVRSHGVPELPAADVVRVLVANRAPVSIVTSASRRSALAVLRALHIPEKMLIGAYVPADLRRAIVSHWGQDVSGVYFDDLERGEDVVHDVPGWSFHHVTPDTTTDDITKAISWTQ